MQHGIQDGWLMDIFYNYLNTAAINTHCICKENQQNGKGVKRTHFLQHIAW
jgi:hypothetical protein